MDTWIKLRLQPNVVTFELLRTDVVEKGVPSHSIVEHLDVFEDIGGRLNSRSVDRVVDELDLQCREEAFCHGIVPAVAAGAERCPP